VPLESVVPFLFLSAFKWAKRMKRRRGRRENDEETKEEEEKEKTK